ncbi:MAG: sensor histidine kinase, partial [Gemmatimonadaceae bacterium]
LLSVGVYGELSATQQVSVGRMRLNMQRAMSLIDYLHDLSRAETGNVAPSCAPLNLAALARSLEEEYDAAAQARGLRLSTELSEDGPIVETDQARVRQIAANLLSNAIKYTEHGTITLRTRRQPAIGRDGSESWAALEVEDSGIGIPADKKEFIFEEFSRLGTSDRAGAGLGLAISKLLAEGLGGRISVASEPGRGSTFTLWLPCCVDAPADVGAVNQAVS